MTIKDIARLAGVSIGTVDRVLHKRGRVSDETRKRVEDIVRQTGYSPNLQASRLSRSKTWTIAAVFPRLEQDNGFWTGARQGVERSNDEYTGLGMTVRDFHYDRRSGEDLIRVFSQAINSGCDGLLLAPVLPDVSNQLLKALPKQIPYILFDTPLPGSRPISFVGQNAAAAGRTAARLLSLRTKNPEELAVLEYSPVDFHIRQRREGFCGFFGHDRAPQVYEMNYGLISDGLGSLIDEIIHDNPSLKGMYVSNAMVGNVALELQKRNLQINLIGHDLTTLNKSLLAYGDIDLLLSQHPARQIFESARLFWRYLALGQDIPAVNYLAIDILTGDNIEFYEEG